jgi:hypothetical protein
LNDEVVKSAASAATALPTIHPFTVIIKLVSNKNRLTVLQDPFHRRKKVIAA